MWLLYSSELLAMHDADVSNLNDPINGLPSETSIESSEVIALGLQSRCHTLLTELEDFEAFIKNQHAEDPIELRVFKNDVQKELYLIERLVKLHFSFRPTQF